MTTLVPKTVRKPMPNNDSVILTSLDDLDDHVRVCWYGDPGTWKTSNAAALAKRGRIVWVRADPGLKRRPLLKRGIPLENIEVFSADAISYEGLSRLQQRMFLELQSAPDAWYGVVWDSITEIYRILIAQMGEANALAADRKGMVRSATKFETDDYQEMNTQIGALIRDFCKLPCHFGVTALPRRDIDKEDGSVKYGPSVAPKLQDHLYAAMDVICYTSVTDVNGQPWGRGRFAAGKYVSKDRFAVMPTYLPIPTFDRILDYVTETITEENDPIYTQLRAELSATKGNDNA